MGLNKEELDQNARHALFELWKKHDQPEAVSLYFDRDDLPARKFGAVLIVLFGPGGDVYKAKGNPVWEEYKAKITIEDKYFSTPKREKTPEEIAAEKEKEEWDTQVKKYAAYAVQYRITGT